MTAGGRLLEGDEAYGFLLTPAQEHDRLDVCGCNVGAPREGLTLAEIAGDDAAGGPSLRGGLPLLQRLDDSSVSN